MKKKFLISFIFLFFPNSFVLANDFQTLYIDIYEKVSTVNAEEIFSRLESDFSDEVEKEVIEGNLPKEFLDKLPGYTKVQKAVDLIQTRHDFESEILIFEEDLMESLLKAPIFSNEVVDDGQFDLIDDLNAIDTILFGEKSKATEPKFAKESSQAFGETVDTWQVGDDDKKEESPMLEIKIEMGSNTNSAYSETDSSISGNLDGIKKALVKLNSKPLTMECTTTRFFEIKKEWLPEEGRLGSTKKEIPQKPKNEPEVLENPKQDIAKQFSGIEKSILNEVQCGVKQKKILIDTGLEQAVNFSLEICGELKEQSFNRLLEGLYKTAEMSTEKQHGFRMAAVLDQWNKHFEAFLDEVTKMQVLLEEISLKKIIE